MTLQTKKQVGRVEKYFLYIVILSIPLNLGKHYILESSYVYGKLIDYVIPTLYVQDILVLILIVLSFRRLVSSLYQSLQKWEFALLFLFFVGIFLSICCRTNAISSWIDFSRIVLYAIFGFYLYSQINLLQEAPKFVWLFSFLLLFQSLLGIGQWLKQGSVFDNYLFFGEQPYSIATPHIVKVAFMDKTHVPPYGTFRHPNVLAGFLVFCILFILGSHPKSPYLHLSILSGTLCLLLTFSMLGILSLFIGVLILFLPVNKVKWFIFGLLLLCLLSTLTIFALSYIEFPLVSSFVETSLAHPSIYRRRNLLLIGWELLKTNLLFGVGLGKSIYFMDIFSVLLYLPKFTQPIHNVYMLFLVETGIFTFLFLIGFLKLLFGKLFWYLHRSAMGKYPRLFLALLISFLFSAFFDHYLITSQQILLLFCLTIGLTLQYNLK